MPGEIAQQGEGAWLRLAEARPQVCQHQRHPGPPHRRMWSRLASAVAPAGKPKVRALIAELERISGEITSSVVSGRR